MGGKKKINKISIVMAYYNRRELLINTLKSIKGNPEIIVVDDASSEEERIEDLPVKVIRINKEDKWWKNPVIPFSKGFKEVTGEMVIIQNPECMYQGDILKYVQENLKVGTYISFACYAPSENRWYNHSVHRPVKYHFCSAIMKEDLDRIGGFSEEYAYGTGYDDDDFVLKIERAGIKIKIIDNPFVIHQFHKNFNYTDENLIKKNYELYQRRLNDGSRITNAINNKG